MTLHDLSQVRAAVGCWLVGRVLLVRPGLPLHGGLAAEGGGRQDEANTAGQMEQSIII